MKRNAFAIFAGIVVVSSFAQAEEFADWTSVVSGGPGLGTFTGVVDGVAVNGQLEIGGDASFNIGPVSNGDFDKTVVNGTSAQYSDPISTSVVFTPTQALGDQLGIQVTGIASGSATLNFSFDALVLNPVFHIANMDSTTVRFARHEPLEGVPHASPDFVDPQRVQVVSGNFDTVNGEDDGLVARDGRVEDGNPATFFGVFPGNSIDAGSHRPSAYGSVLVRGAFTALDLVLVTNEEAVGDDGFNMTISGRSIPTDAIQATNLLVEIVFELNLKKGISNSLDAKLDSAINALDDANSNNDVAAINSLNAFINAVSAQTGNQISESDAELLIAIANAIISALSV